MHRRDFLRTSALAATSLMATPWLRSAPARRGSGPNVLMIAVDDLRCELGCYGAAHMVTPHFDRLAASGTLFNRAYCQVAVCNPSRASLMSGLRPDTLQCHDLNTDMRVRLQDLVTLPQHFIGHGYAAQGLGKIYHLGHGRSDDPASWNRPNLANRWRRDLYALESNRALNRQNQAASSGRATPELAAAGQYRNGPSWEIADVPDDAYTDGAIANAAVDLLGSYGRDPFFLAVGFHKPHLPFNAPKKYWDLYDPKDIDLPPQSDWPEGMPTVAGANWGELRVYEGIPFQGGLDRDQAIRLIHGYRACVSYIDAQLGKLLDALDANGLADETIVALWGDHGFKLGDYGSWCKHTNFEIDTRAPLIIRAPGMPAGGVCHGLVEFIDLYPTLTELANLPLRPELEGASLAPQLQNPAALSRSFALSQFPRGAQRMGYSLRTDSHRFTRWQNVDTRQLLGAELYDHRSDPGETRNLLADRPANDPELAAWNARLDQTWREAHRPSYDISVSPAA
jgi:iduronate 2-sulfatase